MRLDEKLLTSFQEYFQLRIRTFKMFFFIETERMEHIGKIIHEKHPSISHYQLSQTGK